MASHSSGADGDAGGEVGDALAAPTTPPDHRQDLQQQQQQYAAVASTYTSSHADPTHNNNTTGAGAANIHTITNAAARTNPHRLAGAPSAPSRHGNVGVGIGRLSDATAAYLARGAAATALPTSPSLPPPPSLYAAATAHTRAYTASPPPPTTNTNTTPKFDDHLHLHNLMQYEPLRLTIAGNRARNGDSNDPLRVPIDAAALGYDDARRRFAAELEAAAHERQAVADATRREYVQSMAPANTLLVN